MGWGVQVVVDMAKKRTSREEWRQRIDRWKGSGLTAKEFAAEMGINAGTLQFWKYKLGRDVGWRRRGSREMSGAILSSVVELHAPAAETRFEIELGNGRRVRVPAAFDDERLKVLLGLLEAAP